MVGCQCQYMGPDTKLAKQLKHGDPGINRLDRIAKQHNTDHSKAKSLNDKHMANRRMIKATTQLPECKTRTEAIVKISFKPKCQNPNQCFFVFFFFQVLIMVAPMDDWLFPDDEEDDQLLANSARPFEQVGARTSGHF